MKFCLRSCSMAHDFQAVKCGTVTERFQGLREGKLLVLQGLRPNRGRYADSLRVVAWGLKGRVKSYFFASFSFKSLRQYEISLAISVTRMPSLTISLHESA